MKKGLRLSKAQVLMRDRFKRGPDEEGIETTAIRYDPRSTGSFKRGPDEEGIETVN
jgi:hypothetical protein